MLETFENIRRLRKLNNWTQEELATRMGYSDRSMIAKIETGKVDLQQSKILEFAKVFGVDAGDLMGSDGITTPDVDQDRLSKALKMYEAYENSTPDNRTMVDLALKPAQQKP